MVNATKPADQGTSLRVASQQALGSRWVTILYVAFCFEMGVFLFVFPWVSIWHHNFFLARYSWLSVVAQNYYVRGAVSGMGLADIYLAFYELWRMLGTLGLGSSRAPR